MAQQAAWFFTSLAGEALSSRVRRTPQVCFKMLVPGIILYRQVKEAFRGWNAARVVEDHSFRLISKNDSLHLACFSIILTETKESGSNKKPQGCA